MIGVINTGFEQNWICTIPNVAFYQSHAFLTNVFFYVYPYVKLNWILFLPYHFVENIEAILNVHSLQRILYRNGVLSTSLHL
jgi:hypothetical protein